LLKGIVHFLISLFTEINFWYVLAYLKGNDINTVGFLTQTARFVSQAINVYLHLRVIKSCLIWTSLCMVTIDLHYMTDRQEHFDLKNTTNGNKDTYILDALEVS